MNEMNPLEKKVAKMKAEDLEQTRIEIVMMILSDCTESQLKKIDEYDAFKRMAINFIKNNTEEDIDLFIKHNTMFKIIDQLFKR